MHQYIVEVIEVREYLCSYMVEAENEKEALENAEKGYTSSEEVKTFIQVADRYVRTDTLKKI